MTSSPPGRTTPPFPPRRETPEIRVPEDELDITFSTSGGPGGQNVNKVATKVTLRWHPGASSALSEKQKERILRSPVISSRLTTSGAIVLQEQSTRSQSTNRELVIARLHELIRKALTPVKRRIPTKVSRGKLRARAESKQRHSKKKADRRHGRSSD